MLPASTVPLFAYGTLQERGIQITNFGRELSGEPDTLRGYVLVPPHTRWPYPNVTPSPDPAAFVSGVVYELTERELANADEYEGEKYERIRVTLESGRQAWVYLLR